MHIIKVKFIPATSTRGSRIKCSFVGWSQKKSRVYPYPYHTGNATHDIATQYINDSLQSDMAEFGFDFDLIGSSYDSLGSATYVVFQFTRKNELWGAK